MTKCKSIAIAAGIMALSVTAASAATTLYYDRSSFEAALSSFTVDDYDDVTGGSVSTLVRPDYTLTGRVFRCEETTDCGDNNSIGFSHPGYIWNYQPQTLTFDTAVNGVGMDFGYRNNGTTELTIGGNVGPSTKSSTFFGIISDVAFTTISYNLSSGSGSLSDNLTYGTTGGMPAVPVPASLPLLAAGFGIFGLMRRKRKAA